MTLNDVNPLKPSGAKWLHRGAPESPNVKNLKNGGLDQYGPERFGRLILLHSKNAGLKGLNSRSGSEEMF